MPDDETLEQLAALAARIPPEIRFGTSSWTYPGWQGLVYRQKYPKTGAAARMLEEYARYPLFRTVGIDSSFYSPPTSKTLAEYSAYLPAGFPCVSKVWDRITVHTHAPARSRSQGGEPNPDFLNSDLFLREIYEPWHRDFSDHAGPLLFEFQTISRAEKMVAQEFADRLDAFFSKLPREGRYAVELRNQEFLMPPYLAVLREHGVAHLFNSWTRMPSVGEQLDVPGVVSADFIVARILLRPGRYYAEAVDAFAPYDRIQDPNPELRRDVARLIEVARRLRVPAYIIVNNRAEGSAPRTIAAIARLLLGDAGEGHEKEP